MELFIGILFIIVIGYFVYSFIQFLVKMKQTVILPVTKEEIMSIRKHPDKPLDLPVYSQQKTGIILHSFIMLLAIVLFLSGLILQFTNWSLYLIFLLLIANSYPLFNLFAVVEDGLLSGNRFIAWNKIQSFEFVSIDMNHKYYGFSKEANEGYELKIRTKGFPVSCIVTSVEMKEKLINVLGENGRANAEEQVLNATSEK